MPQTTTTIPIKSTIEFSLMEIYLEQPGGTVKGYLPIHQNVV